MFTTLKNAFANKPKMEYSPASIPNMENVEAAITVSVNKSAIPTFILENFFNMSAMISVPPEDAPQLKIMALPTPVKSMA